MTQYMHMYMYSVYTYMYMYDIHSKKEFAVLAMILSHAMLSAEESSASASVCNVGQPEARETHMTSIFFANSTPKQREVLRTH